MNDQNHIIQQGEKSVYVEQGDVHITYAGDRKFSKHLTPRPFKSEVFLGRETDLQTIHDKLFNGNNLLLLVNGNGGVGKTTLASKYYEQYQSDYQHLAWVLSEKSIVNALLTALETPLALNFESAMPTEKRLNLLLTAMAALNKPCLLVIDNANEVEDLNENYQDLRRCSNFHLLLTTRITEFAKAATYRIEGLPENEALALFKEHYQKHQNSEDDLVKQIREAVGGNTLVIELLAKNLNQVNQFETSYSVANLLADLRSKGLLSLSESEAVDTVYQAKGKLREEKPEAIIAAMYDLMALSDAEVALLSVFAVLPAENIPFNTLKSLLSTTENLKPTLKTLAQKGWIEYNPSDNTFKCSPVIQEITRKKNGNLRADCQGLISTLIEKLDRETLHEDNYQQASLMARFGESVLQKLTTADWNLHVLCDAMGFYYQQVGNIEQAQAIYDKGHSLLRQLLEVDPENPGLLASLAITLSWQGTIHADLGNLNQALQCYLERSRLSKELHDSFPDNAEFKDGLAISYERLGTTLTDLGNLEQALQYYQDYCALENELHDSYPNNVEYKNGLAISYERLGTTLTDLGNFDQALQRYLDFNALVQELHDSFPTNVSFKSNLASSHSKLGETYAAIGNLDQALQRYLDFNALVQELYNSFPNNVSFKNGLAISYQYLGKTHAALGKLDQALQFYLDDAALTKELHDSFPTNVEFKNGLAISYQNRGITHAALGNLDQALQFFQDYNALEKELHDSYPNNVEFKNNLAISYSKLGSFYEQTDDKALAVKHYRLAHNLWTELVADFPSYVEFKNNLTWVENKLGDF